MAIVGWNSNGLKNSTVELNSFLSRHGVKVACLQETKLTASSNTPYFPGFATVRRDRPAGGGGGLLTLIHHSLPFVETASPINDGVIETIVIKTKIADLDISITNIYIPPLSSCPANS